MNHPEKHSVVCAGIVVADIVVCPFTGLPDLGTLKLVERTELHVGGCAANTAITLAQLGVETEIVACVGEDEFGYFLSSTLARQGVNISGLVRSPKLATSTTVVLVAANGERSFLHAIGANAGLGPEHFPARLLQRCGILHLGGALLLPRLDSYPMAALLSAARAAGTVTSLDTVWDHSGGWYETLAPCLSQLDILMANESEAAALANSADPDAAADFFLGCGVRWVAIKLGERGCLLASSSERHRLPAFDVPVVDTTGAGDAFAAGFLAGRAAGCDLRTCGLLGCRAGARCVSHVGASPFPISSADIWSVVTKNSC
jgi:sugar/nucleoside kinase (ribokinase family)